MEVQKACLGLFLTEKNDLKIYKQQDSDYVQNIEQKVTIKTQETREGTAILSVLPIARRFVYVNLGSEDEKKKLLRNLKVSKGLEKYKAISVCENLTPTQRKEFKALANAGNSNVT